MDRDALGTLVDMHQAELYRYLRYLGAERTMAEDLLQETFLAALRARNPVANAGARATAAWLRTIARNVYFDFCRSKRHDLVHVSNEYLERTEAVWCSELLRDGDGFDYVEALRACLDTLTKPQRRAIELRYAQSTSRSEMARILGMTENGIKSLLRRLRAALGECVRRRLKLEESGWSPTTNTTA